MRWVAAVKHSNSASRSGVAMVALVSMLSKAGEWRRGRSGDGVEVETNIAVS